MTTPGYFDAAAFRAALLAGDRETVGVLLLRLAECGVTEYLARPDVVERVPVNLDVDDVCSAALLNLLDRMDRLDPARDAHAWFCFLLGAVQNVVKREIRNQNRRNANYSQYTEDEKD